jgi:predicted RNA-binding protein with PUA-like domain
MKKKPADRGAKSQTTKKPVASAAKKTAKMPAKRPAKQSAGTAASSSAPHQDGKWAEWFVRDPGERRYWLLKSEPSTFSWDDLLNAPGRTIGWDGVRNSAARNFIRDGMKRGDLAFFYHSMTDAQAIVGVCEIVSDSHPDPTAFDPKHPQFDEASSRDNPQWYQVSIRAVAPLAKPVPLPAIKARPDLATMALLRIGRLSVTPVRATEWETIMSMGSAV